MQFSDETCAVRKERSSFPSLGAKEGNLFDADSCFKLGQEEEAMSVVRNLSFSYHMLQGRTLGSFCTFLQSLSPTGTQNDGFGSK